MTHEQDNISYINEEYLDIDNPISSIIPDEYHKLLNEIDLNVKCTDKYIDLSKNIKKKLNLTNYIAIHLWLEDDGYIKRYINHLNIFKDMKQYKIYICTSLNMNENIYNHCIHNTQNEHSRIQKSVYG